MPVKKLLHPLMNGREQEQMDSGLINQCIHTCYLCMPGINEQKTDSIACRNKDKGPDFIVLPCAYTITLTVMFSVPYLCRVVCLLR